MDNSYIDIDSADCLPDCDWTCDGYLHQQSILVVVVCSHRIFSILNSIF